MEDALLATMDSLFKMDYVLLSLLLQLQVPTSIFIVPEQILMEDVTDVSMDLHYKTECALPISKTHLAPRILPSAEDDYQYDS